MSGLRRLTPTYFHRLNVVALALLVVDVHGDERRGAERHDHLFDHVALPTTGLQWKRPL